ncbi:MAG: hypothetical protein ACK4PI_12775 [Tepidisphaerales bacterium]
MGLAQAAEFTSILLASLVLLVLCLGGFWAVVMLRRKLKEDDSPAKVAGGFTLDDLRTLLAEGKMTQEEFDRAKHQIITAMKARQAQAVLQKQAEEAKARVRGGDGRDGGDDRGGSDRGGDDGGAAVREPGDSTPPPRSTPPRSTPPPTTPPRRPPAGGGHHHQPPL